MSLGPASIGVVLHAMDLERVALLDLLGGLDADDWRRPTECPAYDVKGIATHVLGDDLSLLSRQRDGAESGLFRVALGMPGADFRSILDTFNDRWVEAAAFLSPDLVRTLLALTGEWAATYYEAVDPAAPGEPVGFFGPTDGTSPFWQAIAREYIERWVHHSQIRRALGQPSLADDPFLPAGAAVVAAIVGGEVQHREGDGWQVGPLHLGERQQAADLLTRAHTADEVKALVQGDPTSVKRFAAVAGRP